MRKILFIVISLMFVMLTACGSGTASPQQDSGEAGYSTVSAEEVKALLDEGSYVLLFDVRRADEYEAGHIPSALNYPNEDIGEAILETIEDLDTSIIVYCRSGRRSKEAANKLIELGYTNVQDLGGINDWPYDTVVGSNPSVWISDSLKESLLNSGIKFSTTDLTGSAVDESVFKDYSLTMINVWATFCGPCIEELPGLGELAKEYRSQGVQIIGLVSDVFNSDGSISESQLSIARDIVDETGADYLHIVPSDDMNKMLMEILYVPTTFFVDKDGKQIGDPYVSSKSKEEWQSIIDKKLKEISK